MTATPADGEDVLGAEMDGTALGMKMVIKEEVVVDDKLETNIDDEGEGEGTEFGDDDDEFMTEADLQ